jgi:dTDP-4-dehydrorhamnose reductase
MDPRTRQTIAGEMPRLFTDEYRCPIFVDDLADALIELATNDFIGGLNVVGPQRLSRYEFGLKLARAFRVESKFAPALSASSPVPRPRDCTLDISLAQKILRTRLRSVNQVLIDLLNA